jgi:methylated-DNA-[protein]-cysteine S-methyltransferase
MATSFALIRTGWGVAAVLGSGRGPAAFVWPQRSADQARRSALRLAGRASGITEVPAERICPGLAKRLDDYLAGRPVDFCDLSADLSSLPPFTRRVLTELRRVRRGKTISYAALARRAGRPNGARAVGQAMAANPLPIIVPCHRVVRSDGGLGGYSGPGGVVSKRRLLAMESSAEAT